MEKLEEGEAQEAKRYLFVPIKHNEPCKEIYDMRNDIIMRLILQQVQDERWKKIID